MVKKNVSVGCIMLRRYQQENRMNLKQLADEFGVYPQVMKGYLSGEYMPGYEFQKKANRSLGVVNDWMDDTTQYNDEQLLAIKGL